MTWCIDLTVGRADVTTRIAHAFPDTPRGAVSATALCGIKSLEKQDVQHTRHGFIVCERCRERAS